MTAFQQDAYRPLVTVWGSLSEWSPWSETPSPWTETLPPGQRLPHPGQRPQTETPFTETSLDRDPLPKGTWDQTGQRPRRNMGPETETGGTWDQSARQEVTSYRDPPRVDRQTPVKTLPCPKLRLRAVISTILNTIFRLFTR